MLIKHTKHVLEALVEIDGDDFFRRYDSDDSRVRWFALNADGEIHDKQTLIKLEAGFARQIRLMGAQLNV